MPTFDQVLAVKEKYKKELFKKNGVTMVSVGKKNGDGELSVIVNVIEKLSINALARDQILPTELDGVKVDVVKSGEVKASADPKQRMRPAQAGISIGHKDITAGTFGCLVKDEIRKKYGNNRRREYY